MSANFFFTPICQQISTNTPSRLSEIGSHLPKKCAKNMHFKFFGLYSKTCIVEVCTSWGRVSRGPTVTQFFQGPKINVIWDLCIFSIMLLSAGAGDKSLNLIGMRQGTFTPLVILGLDFVIKNFQIFLRWKLTSIGLICHPAQLLESYETCP